VPVEEVIRQLFGERHRDYGLANVQIAEAAHTSRS